jgi:hypothetical protein
LSVCLLAMVAGLLLALWFQLRDWRQANKAAPLLAEQLAEQLLAARKGLADLKATLTANGPELNRLLGDAGKLRVELQYLLQRGEQLAQKLDTRTLARTGEVSVELVAGANGQAASRNLAKPDAPAALTGDPLEELLAGLQQGDDGLIAKAGTPKRKRAGSVTQAELDLQQNLQRKDTH